MTRILLIEDDADVRDITKLVLEQNGMEVDTAASSTNAAAHLLGGRKYDLVLPDVMIPGPFDGVEIIRTGMKFVDPFPPVIFLTGVGDAGGLRPEAEALGAGILTKPCSMASIIDAVKKKLEGA